jgi:hypothetical protein
MVLASPLKKYTTNLAIAGGILAVFSFFAQKFFLSSHLHSLWFLILLFVCFVQWLVFAFVQKSTQSNAKTILKQYQTAKYAKLLVYFVVLAMYVYIVKEKALVFPFLTNFIVYYIVFTVLEVFTFQRWMNTLPPTGKREL